MKCTVLYLYTLNKDFSRPLHGPSLSSYYFQKQWRIDGVEENKYEDYWRIMKASKKVKHCGTIISLFVEIRV